MALGLRKFSRFKQDIRIPDMNKCTRFQFLRCYCQQPQPEKTKEEFDVLKIYPKRTEQEVKDKKIFREPNTPRVNFMDPSMDWTNIWPGPRTYHPATVPLPVRQGVNKHGAPPGRFANTELMKIPNFLHLTPPAINKHCEKLKSFCTKWPEELNDEKNIEKHFPVEVITSDYCHSSSSIRDPNARIVTIRIKLSNLELDAHARDKFLRLVGERYDPKTDYVTLTTDSCPLKKQNYDYAHYLLTAVYFESWKKEEWESLKGEEDMEKYIFSQRECFRNVKKHFDYYNKSLPDLKEFGEATEKWINEGDGPEVAEKYKKAAVKLLQLPSFD